MPTKTKEDILDNYVDELKDDASPYPESVILKAMDDWAKIEAIEFAEWVKDNSYTKSECKGWYQYYSKREDMGNFMITTPVYMFFTIEEIYQLYLSQKEK